MKLYQVDVIDPFGNLMDSKKYLAKDEDDAMMWYNLDNIVFPKEYKYNPAKYIVYEVKG